MLTGHTSHQIGLDADIWLTPMPDHIMTPQEREDMTAVSMLKDPFSVDPNIFTLAQVKLIRRAASYPQVARIFVHPAIKKALCQMAPQVGKDTSWLGKVRPWWNHHYHFHIRLTCPPGSDGCENQKPPTGRQWLRPGADQLVRHAEKVGDRDGQAACPGRQALGGQAAAHHGAATEGMRHGADLGRLRAAGAGGRRCIGYARPPCSPRSATKDAGPPVPILTAAQLKALTGGTDPGGHALAGPQSLALRLHASASIGQYPRPCRSDGMSRCRPSGTSMASR